MRRAASGEALGRGRVRRRPAGSAHHLGKQAFCGGGRGGAGGAASALQALGQEVCDVNVDVAVGDLLHCWQGEARAGLAVDLGVSALEGACGRAGEVGRGVDEIVCVVFVGGGGEEGPRPPTVPTAHQPAQTPAAPAPGTNTAPHAATQAWQSSAASSASATPKLSPQNQVPVQPASTPPPLPAAPSPASCAPAGARKPSSATSMASGSLGLTAPTNAVSARNLRRHPQSRSGQRAAPTNAVGMRQVRRPTQHGDGSSGGLLAVGAACTTASCSKP